MRIFLILLLFSTNGFAQDKVRVVGSGQWMSDQDCSLNEKYPQASDAAKSLASKSPSFRQNDYKYCIKEHELGLSVFFQFATSYYEGNLLPDAPGKHGMVITNKEGKFINYVPGT